MRKRIFLTLVLSLCMANFGAFAANNTRGNARGNVATNNAQTQSAAAPVAARAGARQTVKASPTAAAAQPSPAVSGNTAARAGKKQTVKSAPATASAAPKPMAARAGATQKVLQQGTKVATATENTVVSQECQDAFYGCMDAFCMLDNASGGRCQCSDRVTELDKVLEDILKLDEQSYIMATEGVERIQMGEAEEQIMARAKAAANNVTLEDKKDKNLEEAKKKVRQLDLSAWNNNIFSDSDDDDVFAASAVDLVDTFADKKGDKLYNAAAKMCIGQIPTQCKASGQMMQLVYAQKIKSDCTAYENSLKQQKSASQQKLQTAQKALRDAALDEYKDQNKYGTAGECAVAFAQCMQEDAGCGSDYTGCVTLAAKENVANNKAGTKATQTTIKGVVAGADITLAASTMEALLAKKEICAHITKQCINSNKNDEVWNVFIRNAAPALSAAEETAEQRLRMSCIPSVADCFKEACKSTIDPNNPEGSYDMCLSNPGTYKSLCKVQLEPCLAATGGTYEKPEKSNLWKGLNAALAAMKVDACTKEITSCLTERCEEDFSGCIGLSDEAIIGICPTDKLTACETDNKFGSAGKTDITSYVKDIAQGLKLKINNNLIAACQTAVDTAMKKACGDTSTCASATVPEKNISEMLTAQICDLDGENCFAAADGFSNEAALKGLIVKVKGPDLSAINYTSKLGDGVDSETIATTDFFGCSTDNDDFSASTCAEGSTQMLANLLNKTWQAKISEVISDQKVSMCLEGRTDMDETVKILKRRGKKNIEQTIAKGNGLTNLTQNSQMIIASGLMDNLQKAYDDAMKVIMRDKVPGLMTQITAKVEKAAAEAAEKEAAENNMLENICKTFESFSEKQPSVHGCKKNYYKYTATYDKTAKTCVVVKYKYGRKTDCHCGVACPWSNDPKKSKTEKYDEEALKTSGAQPFDIPD